MVSRSALIYGLLIPYIITTVAGRHMTNGLRLKKPLIKLADLAKIVNPEMWGVESGPWQPVLQQADKKDNICKQDKFLPKLYVLGNPKSASTSLAANLMYAGVTPVGPDCRGGDTCKLGQERHDVQMKELHFFDTVMNYSKQNESMKNWLDVLPDCPHKNNSEPLLMKQVIGDFTPNYMQLVPRPKNAETPGKDRPYMNWDTHTDLPKVLSEFYGKDSQNITFAVMLREPLERLQSLWHCCMCPDKKAEKCGPNRTFAGDLEKAMGKHPLVYSDWLWQSSYSRQLKGWLQYFHPSQFVIIPMHEINRENRGESVCRELSTRLNFEMGCDSKGASIQRVNVNKHPSLEQEAGLDLVHQFRKMVEPENTDLFKTLGMMHLQGAGLANYDGPKGYPEAIESWLRSGW